jgi:TonB family protein
MRTIAAAAVVTCVALAAVATSATAQDAPLLAGSEVEAPRRTQFVRPEYPPEASARGLRGIVILELIIDEQGNVADVEVVRSVPPFDEAAVAAARQWEYEPTRVEGKPVRVRLTVPITFAIKLPSMQRARGIPELRQGVSPPVPRDAGAGQASAKLTLKADGQVVDALIEGGEAPWADALLLAISTWRFAPAEGGRPVSFRVLADFEPKKAGGSVRLQLVELQRLETLPEVAADESGPAGPADEADTAAAADNEASAAEPAQEAAGPQAPEATEEVTAPSEAEGSQEVASEEPAATEAREEPGPTAPPSGPAAEEPEKAQQPAAAAEEPVIEVIPSTRGLPTPQPTPEPRPQRPGISSVAGVALANGVPDLSDGRTPVVPPFARMANASGTLRVRFSVDSAGVTTVSSIEGPELLQLAAGQVVESWKFRRETAERLRLIAMIIYEGDNASATVTLQE